MSIFELHRFSTPFRSAHYTDSRWKVNLSGVDYLPRAIERTQWDHTLELKEIKTTLPWDLWPLDEFVTTGPTGIILHEIFNPAGTLLFSGEVMGAEFGPKIGEGELTTESMTSMLRAEIPQRTYSPVCPWNLGSEECGVDLDDFTITFPVSEAVIGDKQISHPDIDAKINTFFTMGMVKVGEESQLILKHEDDTIFLLEDLREFGDPNMKVIAGCDKSRLQCLLKFFVPVNHGGMKSMPTFNPSKGGFR